MNLATLLRYADLKYGGAWDKRYCIPYYWKLMAEKYNIGINAVMSEYGFEKICENCDGLIVPGSSTHINPKYWGGEPFAEQQAADEYPLDAKLIEYFINNNKPVIGICGGLQAINVFLGGSLKEVDESIHSNPDAREHTIIIKENSFIHTAFDSKRAEVNSYHCWAIDKLAPGLECVAETEDGVIEAVEWTEKKIFATQWHPELSFAEGNAPENKIFENFIELCR